MVFVFVRLAKGKDEGDGKLIFDALLNKIPLMLKFLANEDDDVSSAVGKFSHDWLTLLKTMKPLDNTLKQSVKELLHIVIRKMKYDDSYNFENEACHPLFRLCAARLERLNDLERPDCDVLMLLLITGRGRSYVRRL